MRTVTGRRTVALLAAMLIGVAACGSSTEDGEDTGVASLAHEAPAGGAATGEEAAAGADGDDAVEAPEDPELAFELYDRCLADAGFDLGATLIAGDDASGVVSIDELELGTEVDPQSQSLGSGDIDDFGAEFQEVEEACARHLANLDLSFDLSPEEQAAMEDAQLAWAECMRENGVDVPDFEPGAGNVQVFGDPIDDSDPQASGGFDDDGFDFEAFEQANEACNEVFENTLGDTAIGGAGAGGGDDS